MKVFQCVLRKIKERATTKNCDLNLAFGNVFHDGEKGSRLQLIKANYRIIYYAVNTKTSWRRSSEGFDTSGNLSRINHGARVKTLYSRGPFLALFHLKG